MRSLLHALDARWQANPGVHTFFIDGKGRRREVGICEGAYGYSDILFVIALDRVVNRCTALGAKTERDAASPVADADVFARFAVNRDRTPGECGLGSEHTSGTALTCEAMTSGNSDWFRTGRERELPATARGCSCIHAVEA